MTGIKYQTDSTAIISSVNIALKSAVAIVGFTTGVHTPFYAFLEGSGFGYKIEKEIVCDWKNWEIKLRGVDSTGFEGYLSLDSERILILNSFAFNLVNSQEQIPVEFESTFKKKFWDILA